VFKAEQLMEEPPCFLSIDDPMTTVMDRFQRTKAKVLPVLDKSGKFVGLIDQTRLFAAYRQMLVDFSEE
jgi:CBS domain-containing protein